MYVDKEVAKRIIDEAPGKIWIDSFNGITFIHTRPRQITVDEGKRIINKANTIDYQDNDFFGLLSLDGVQEFIVHNIKFPQHSNDICKSWKLDSQYNIMQTKNEKNALIEKLNATKKLVNRKICCINFCRRKCEPLSWHVNN